ncbi:hypothetical protein BHM03_00010833 [Ensete ventricosum]|uniref:N-acetyltransferase domain-containing protein n=1 Tax=Ensete ventricosum TaxID=4639 RepID=A0A426ZYE2_ENSVE|nr:hypothetical protein B296_00026182 [Ensete ventricosum]RZR84056.1 hypothetical protein BHM03_00010833 [Ensete ventricosum]
MGAGGRGVEMAAAITLDGVRDKNVMQLKKLNAALFPVRYNDKYYADALASGDFTKLGPSQLLPLLSWVAATISYLIIEKKIVYLTSWVGQDCGWCFAGTKLLSHVLDVSCKQNISEVYLHVQTNNDDAIALYKKLGFEIVDTIQNYYMNISPPDCYVLSKSIIAAAPQAAGAKK